MTDLYFYQLQDTPDWTAYESFLPQISEERRERIGRMPSAKNKILSLSAELLLRRIACKRLSVPNDALQLATAEHGKPYLCGHKDFHFNWSHTGDALVLAVSNTPVGVDIEMSPPRGDVHKLSRRFFTKKEASAVAEASDSAARFCELWTRKEAYTKYTGSGLTVALDSFDVTEEPDLTTLWHENYVISFCCASPDYRLTLLTEQSPVPSFEL